MKLTRLEESVIDMLLQGEHPTLQELRLQLPHVEVASREHSGAGFFTELRVKGECEPAAADGEIELSDVVADIEGLEYGAGFTLCIRNGIMCELEGYAFGESWPVEVRSFTLRYGQDGGSRDLTNLPLA